MFCPLMLLLLRWTFSGQIKCQSKCIFIVRKKKRRREGKRRFVFRALGVGFLLVRLNAVDVSGERVSIMDTLETSHKMKCGQGSGYQMAWLHMGMLLTKKGRSRRKSCCSALLYPNQKQTAASSSKIAKNTRSIKIDHNNKKEASTLIFSDF